LRANGWSGKKVTILKQFFVYSLDGKNLELFPADVFFVEQFLNETQLGHCRIDEEAQRFPQSEEGKFKLLMSNK
jgi:hypothetical protein